MLPDYKTLIPAWAGTAVAVGTALVFLLIALAIVRFSKALGGVVGAGAGLVGASSLLPWIKASGGGETIRLDAWKHGDEINNIYNWTGAGGGRHVPLGWLLVVTAVLMLVLGVLPGRLGLLRWFPR